MERSYQKIVDRHFRQNRQMLFLAGPRQVGKTTISKHVLAQNKGIYINWDAPEDRALFLGNTQDIISKIKPVVLGDKKPYIVFDEIHKFKDWKNRLKGIHDKIGQDYHILVTGSAKLDVYHKGGDSLMGRYFLFTVHPLSVGEMIPRDVSSLFYDPYLLPRTTYEQLYHCGGFPEPFLKASDTFTRQWKSTRHKQLIREDLREMGNIQELDQLELLALSIRHQIGSQLNYTSLASKIRISDHTIRRWMSLLQSTYYCFLIHPWSQNIPRAILKDPKVYLWDWSDVDDPGARFENFIACHLHKAVDYWNESGTGSFGLYYLRDKEKREVDFVVTRDNIPWMLVEAKLSHDFRISPALIYFAEKTKAEFVFQVVHNMDYIDHSCFATYVPVIVPAQTLLSQLF